MSADLYQADLFSQAPTPATRMPASASRVTRRRTAPIVVGGLPPGATADIEIMVHDGITNRTYFIQ